MKKNYHKPTMRVMRIQHHSIICSSPDVINPGAPNRPAAVRSYNNYSVWDDDWQNQ